MLTLGQALGVPRGVLHVTFQIAARNGVEGRFVSKNMVSSRQL